MKQIKYFGWILLLTAIPFIGLSQGSPILKNKLNDKNYYNIPKERAEIIDLKARHGEECLKINTGLKEFTEQLVEANLKSQASTVEIQREYSRLLKTCSEVDYKFKVLTDQNNSLKESLKKSDEIIVFKDKEIEKYKKRVYTVAGSILVTLAGILIVAK